MTSEERLKHELDELQYRIVISQGFRAFRLVVERPAMDWLLDLARSMNIQALVRTTVAVPLLRLLLVRPPEPGSDVTVSKVGDELTLQVSKAELADLLEASIHIAERRKK